MVIQDFKIFIIDIMRRNIRLLAFFNFFTDLQFHSAVLVIYFARITNSFTLAMSLFAVSMISSALFEVPTGIFSDLIGRKRTVILGAFSAFISAILYALGTNYWILFLGATFNGLSNAWYSGNNDALFNDSLRQTNNRHKFDEYLGKINSFSQAARMIGVVIGSIIAYWSFPIIMWLSVIPQFICIIISFFIIDPKVFRKESANIFSHIHLSSLSLWKNKKLRLLSIRYIISEGVGEANFQFGAAFINTLWPIWAIGLSRALSYFGAVVSLWFSSKIIKKIGIYKILIVYDVVNRFLGLTAAIISNIFSPILMSLTSILFGPGSTAATTLRQKEYPKNQQATMASLNSLMAKLVYGIFSIVLGSLADRFGPAKAYLIAQILLSANILTAIKLNKKN